MKHTTFENELRDIRRNAINELKDAISAHGGRVEWEDGHMPFLKHADFDYVEKINERLLATIIGGGKYVLSVDDMSIEQIIAITEAIPETDEVKDVSGVYPVPVTWVDLDDVENAGFDTKGLTQADLDEIKDEMAESYLIYGFNEDLINACEDYGLKEKEN